MNRRIADYRATTEKVVSMLAERKIHVTQQGTNAFVEYKPNGEVKRVNLPHIPDDADDRTLDAIRGFLDHEVAHVLFTDHPAVKRVLSKLPSEAEKQPGHNLYNILEDTRIEREMQKRFPGSAGNLSSVLGFVLDKFSRPELAKAVAAGDQQAAFGVGLVPLIRAWAGQRVAQEFCDEVQIETLLAKAMPTLAPFKARVPTLKSSKEAAELGLEMLAALRKSAAPPPPPPPPPPAPPQSSDESDADEPEDQEERSEQETPPESGEGEGAQDGEQDESSEEDEPGQDQPDDGEEGEPDTGTGTGSGASDDEGEDESDSEPEEEQSEGGGQGDDAGEAPEEEDEESEGGDPSDGDAEGEPDTGKDEQRGAASAEEAGGGSENPDESMPDEDAEGEDGEAAEEAGDQVQQVLNDLLGAMGDITADQAAQVLSSVLQSSIEEDDYLPYTNDFDTFEEVQIPDHVLPLVDLQVAKADEKMRHMVGQIQAQMRRLFAQQAFSVNYSGQRRGRLHTPSLHRLSAGDNRVFSVREEHDAVDTAVSLLIDCSGSMYGEKIKLACESAYALSQTLERLGIAHEILGFTTNEGAARSVWRQAQEEADKLGRPFSRIDPIRMYVFKGFEERFTVAVKRRLMGAAGNIDYNSPRTEMFGPCIAMEANVDGESVQIAANRLRRRREPRKILMVLSDGAPSAGLATHLHAHLKQVVEECEKSGIETVGIGIMDRAVQQFYKKFLVLSNVAQLPAAVMGELRRFLVDKKAA